MPDDDGLAALAAALNVPRRGDAVEAWLERHAQVARVFARGSVNHEMYYKELERLLADYREHADAGVPLDQEVPRG